jgi:hypothetical protein
MYQAVSSLPIWQLHNGRLVHLQEGAFLPPKEPAAAAAAAHIQPQQQQEVVGATSSSSITAASTIQQQQQQQQRIAAPATGLGAEAREFITQHLPLFNVPWRIVAELEAAAIPGLRIVSPQVLRPLLRRLGERQLVPGEMHPFAALSAVQALQLLEFCCSDLAAPDRRSSSSSGGTAAPGGAAVAGGTAAEATHRSADGDAAAAAGGSSSSSNIGMMNLPEGAAAVVGDVLGPMGLTVLRGLANQLQNQLAAGIDEVLNTVMDAMNDPQQQQQQQVPPAAAAGRVAGGAVASQPADATAAAAAADASTARCSYNMNRVNWLRGLPVPTAAGTVAVLGSSILFVCPDSCQPSPTALLPSHLLREFVSPECVAALSWALKYPEVREELGLAFYGLQHLAAHLKDALGPTWEFVGPTGAAAASSSSSGAGRSEVEEPAAATARPTAAAAAAVPWKEGACGGPYLDWLQRLWCVILHIIAAAPLWQEDLTWGAAAAASSSSSRGSASARVVGSIRNAAERARGLGRELIADVLSTGGDAAAAMMAQAEFANEHAGTQMTFGSAAPNSALVAAASAAVAAEMLWRPLEGWPLLPLADGRLLQLRHRELVMAVLPEYADPAAAAAEGDGSMAEARQWVSCILLEQQFLFACLPGVCLPCACNAFCACCKLRR